MAASSARLEHGVARPLVESLLQEAHDALVRRLEGALAAVDAPGRLLGEHPGAHRGWRRDVLHRRADDVDRLEEDVHRRVALAFEPLLEARERHVQRCAQRFLSAYDVGRAP
jgi:hypothetical protein